MKYVTPVIINGIEEAGIVTNLMTRDGEDTLLLRDATVAVVLCSRGYLEIALDEVPIYMVH